MTMPSKITISWLAETIRPYTVNPKGAYQYLLNDIFACLTENYYNLASTASSRIMNREYDVPQTIRDVVNKSEVDKLREKLNDYFHTILMKTYEDRMYTELKKVIGESFLSNGFKTQVKEQENLYELLFLLTITAIQTDNRERLKTTIYDEDNFKLRLISGDMIALAFNKKEATNFRIVVIPVDKNFTMELGKRSDDAPLIAKDSIHGKFLIRLEKQRFNKRKSQTKLIYICKDNDVKIGKLTIGNSEFWLVPVSKLGERHKATSSVEMIENAIDAILDEYDIAGQGEPLFIPLLGTGRARVFSAHNDSLKFIKDKIFDKADKLKGEINLVIYKKDYANDKLKGENYDSI